MDTKIELKEEPMSELNLQNRMDFVNKCRVNKDISNHNYINNNKMEIKVEPCLEELPRDIKPAAVDAPVSDADLDNNVIDYFPPELVIYKNSTDISRDCKIEIKEEPWYSEFTLQSNISVQNICEFQESLPQIQKCLSTPESQSTYKGASSDIYTIGDSKETYGLKNKQYQKDHENLHTCDSDMIGSSYSQCSQDGHTHNTNTESPALNLENQKCKTKSNTSAQEVLECKICNKAFQKKHHLKRHNLVHENGKLYRCQSCEKSFTSQSNLRRHCSVHDGTRPYKCSICERSFTDISGWKRHNLAHERKMSQKCDICQKSFKSLPSLQRHKLIHDGIKAYKCDICNKSFIDSSGINRHKLLHESERPYKCEICDKGFTQKYGLKMHKLTHYSNKAYKCEVCEKNFTDVSELERHNLSHESQRSHTCDICKKSFFRISNLNRHRMIHEGKKPHKCKICGRSFTHRFGLNKHTLVHEGIKPFKCNMCDKSFTHKYSLKMHLLLHEEANIMNAKDT